MAHFASNASVTKLQNAIHLRSDDRGEVFVSSLSSLACAIVATSRDTLATASGLVYRIVAAACGGTPGGQLAVMNGGLSLTHICFSQNSESVIIDFGTGACFSSLITEKRNSTGVVFVTSIIKGYGMG